MPINSRHLLKNSTASLEGERAVEETCCFISPAPWWKSDQAPTSKNGETWFKPSKPTNHFTARTLPKTRLTPLARPAQYRVECRRLDDIMLSEWFSYDTELSYPKRIKDCGLLLGVINKAVLALPFVGLSAMRWPSITNTIHQKPVKIYFAHTCLLSNICGEDFHNHKIQKVEL